MWEVVVGGAGDGGAEVDALEGFPGDEHPTVPLVVDEEAAVAGPDVSGAGEGDLAAVEQGHDRAFA